MLRYLLISLVFIASPVAAQECEEPGTATLSWGAPTQNTDGTPLTDLAGYNVYWGVASGVYTEGDTLMNPEVTSYVVPCLSPGVWYFASTAVNSAGVESALSNEASKTIEAEDTQPQPPTNLRVLEENQTAYAISQSENVVRLYPTGTIPAGAECDGTMEVLGRFRVNREDVIWPDDIGERKPAVVFANCGGG